MGYWFLSFFVGFLAVLQGGLNREIMKNLGLAGANLLSNAVVLLISFVFLFVTYRYPNFFAGFMVPKLGDNWRWWYILPGFCGFGVVAGIPAAIPKLGATGVFLCLMVAQMGFSLLWDLKVEHIPIDAKRLIGVCVALLGLFISSRS